MEVELRSRSESDTLEIARELGSLLSPGDVVALYGELGAGKTLFCKGVGEAMGIPSERVVSPSFTIVTEHTAPVPLFHIDAYRLAGERQAEEIGLDEVLCGDGICFVEWAEKVEDLLPNRCIRVKFLILNETGRLIRIASGDAGRLCRLASRCERFVGGGEA
ncbi:MAG: tRNA (adenosine(37)-N6)-threonylcarbamoyltransferase complex ATPase subunit type 1 TsaE [Deltaproteobacteria bacterium]|nr:tRNA (adenosine(37)-N6)-threonylcarbamoyltransferase complex ATPase subunit type 1 TsaE [Deltaproteobacteria bacterium]